MMKLMTKVSLLVALAVIVTIGGVYATWNYSTSASGVLTSSLYHPELTAMVEGTSDNGQFGTVESSILLKIDDPADDGISHKAVLQASGNVVALFQPKDGIDMTTVSLYWTIKIPTTYKYEGTDIFKNDFSSIASGNQYVTIPYSATSDNFVEITTENKGNVFSDYQGVVYQASEDAVGSYAMLITAEEILQVLHLNQDFILDTVSDYGAFSRALSAGSGLKLVISDNPDTLLGVSAEQQ